MTVGELRKILSDYNDSDLVILASDPEGHSYRLLSDCEDSIYADRKVFLRTLTPELEAQGYTQDFLYNGPDGQSCIVLYPED